MEVDGLRGEGGMPGLFTCERPEHVRRHGRVACVAGAVGLGTLGTWRLRHRSIEVKAVERTARPPGEHRREHRRHRGAQRCLPGTTPVFRGARGKMVARHERHVPTVTPVFEYLRHGSGGLREQPDSAIALQK